MGPGMGCRSGSLSFQYTEAHHPVQWLRATTPVETPSFHDTSRASPAATTPLRSPPSSRVDLRERGPRMTGMGPPDSRRAAPSRGRLALDPGRLQELAVRRLGPE